MPKPKILVVDDELMVLRSVTFLLEKNYYEFKTAVNGKIALKLAQEENFDLVLSDLNMPVMDGNELIRTLRTMPEYKYVPFLILSANNEEETWVKNLEEGADDFITKPFNKDVLISKIKAHVNKYRQQKAAAPSKSVLDLKKKSTLLCCYSGKNYFKVKENDFLNVQYVYDKVGLYYYFSEEEIPVLIIDKSAKWAVSQLKKIREIKPEISIIYITDKIEDDEEDLYIKGVDHIISNKRKFIDKEILSFIKRDVSIKDKYQKSIIDAAVSSPVKFDKSFNISLNSMNVNISHEPYEGLPGGDFYEVFHAGKKRVVIFGDVMGKKWRAWLFVHVYIAYIRSTIKFLMNSSAQDDVFLPEEFLKEMNSNIYKDLSLAEVFTTLCVVVIDDERALVQIASAGAMRPLYYNAKENTQTRLNIVGTLMGILENVNYQRFELVLNENDKILFFTDGFTEAFDHKKSEMLKIGSVAEVFKGMMKNTDLTPEKIEEELINKYNIETFDDDRTMLLISGKNS